MPDEFLVIEFHSGEHGVARVCAAQLIFARWHAIDGDKEPTALGHPLWNCVRQFFADGQIHARSVARRSRSGKRKRQRGPEGSGHAPARTGVTRPTMTRPTNEMQAFFTKQIGIRVLEPLAQMSDNIATREFSVNDYEAALRVWQRVDGIEIAEGDDQQGIAQFLARNPGLSRVATIGSAVIGVALCGHDGRRGHIYHLAVDPHYQGRGLGRRLLHECLDGLRRAGLERAIILVANDNPRGRGFWLRYGWEEIPGAVPMGIDL